MCSNLAEKCDIFFPFDKFCLKLKHVYQFIQIFIECLPSCDKYTGRVLNKDKYTDAINLNVINIFYEPKIWTQNCLWKSRAHGGYSKYNRYVGSCKKREDRSIYLREEQRCTSFPQRSRKNPKTDDMVQGINYRNHLTSNWEHHQTMPSKTQAPVIQ